MFTAVRAFAAEPAVPDPPRRVWRDWAIVGVATTTAILEVILRTDVHWPIASLIVCLTTIPLVLVRRQRPLLAMSAGFGLTMAYSLVLWLAVGRPVGLLTGATMLINLYAVYRWGSGRHGLIAVPIVVATAVIGNLTDARTASDVIGGSVVLMLPVALGLLVRFRSVASDRRLETVRADERVRLARDLHDTVAHHVSAIAVQAQAGKAVAATRPQMAVEVLDVIEREASRTLAEMRSIVGTLRTGTAAELTPQPGLGDLRTLAFSQPIAVDVRIGAEVGALGATVDTTLYRIAQEALTNAVRHGTNVTAVTVSVTRAYGQVTLTVDDNGDVPASQAGVGYGIAGMSERAELLGGSLNAGPLPVGRGWRVVAQIPIEEQW